MKLLMKKLTILLILILTYAGYTAAVYTTGTESNIKIDKEFKALVIEGKQLYQEYNCSACHQIYGLGGYLGPELTTAYSDKHRGEFFLRAMMESGGERMPKFNFTPKQTDALIAYLKYVDTTATPVKFHYQR